MILPSFTFKKGIRQLGLEPVVDNGYSIYLTQRKTKLLSSNGSIFRLPKSKLRVLCYRAEKNSIRQVTHPSQLQAVAFFYSFQVTLIPTEVTSLSHCTVK